MGLFSSVPVATEVQSRAALPAGGAAYAEDAIALTWQDRTRVRARWVSEGGLEFAVQLPRGTTLQEGDLLLPEGTGRAVVVHAAAEPVLVLRPSSAREQALWAYLIGNNHQLLMFDADGIVCQDTPDLVAVLAYHGIPAQQALRPFTPVSSDPGHVRAL